MEICPGGCGNGKGGPGAFNGPLLACCVNEDPSQNIEIQGVQPLKNDDHQADIFRVMMIGLSAVIIAIAIWWRITAKL